MSNAENNANIPVKKDKLGFITLMIIISIIVSSFVFFGVFMLIRNTNINASMLFEKAYDKVAEFDSAPNVDSKIEMEKDVLDALGKVIVYYPNTPSGKRALYYKGHVLYYTKNYEKAEKVFKTFIEQNKHYYNLTDKAYYFLSYCYSENNNIDEAIKVLDEFIKKYKDSYYQPLALYRLGNLYEIKNDKSKALSSYQQIIEKYPTSSQKGMASGKIALLNNDVKL